MKKPSLSDIGNLAEAIAAVAVVASLVYLGVQIQQNTKAVRASSYQEVANGITNFLSLLAQNEELARIYLHGTKDPKQLSPEESLRFESALAQLFVKYDVAVYFYRQHFIDEMAIEPYTRLVLLLLENPGVVDYWERSQHFYSANMRNYIKKQRGG